MWSKAQGEDNTGARRKELLEKGYELFSTKSIEAISMRDVAKGVDWYAAVRYAQASKG